MMTRPAVGAGRESGSRAAGASEQLTPRAPAHAAMSGTMRRALETAEAQEVGESSDQGEGDPPVPMPTTVVKPFSVDGTARTPRGRVDHCWTLFVNEKL